MDRSATTPERSADRADTRPPGPLLLPELPARTRNQLAILGRRGTLPQCCAVMFHRLPQQSLIDLAREDLVQQFELPDLFATEIYYVNLCHRLFSLRRLRRQATLSITQQTTRAPARRGYFFLAALVGAAFFEALSGSSVEAPAKPRRSRGGAFAFEIST